MSESKVIDEIVEFIASGASRRQVAEFQPSESAKSRVAELISNEKNGNLSRADAAEMDRYLLLEHLMRLAKARARKMILDESSPPRCGTSAASR